MSHYSSFGWLLVVHVKKNCRALGRYDGIGVSLARELGSEGHTRFCYALVCCVEESNKKEQEVGAGWRDTYSFVAVNVG